VKKERILYTKNAKSEFFIAQLPYLKYIKQLSDPKVVSTPWSPPDWMVEARNATEGYTRLKDNYYQVYAEYFIK
jgi:O-glycosyl hydrolase